MRHALKFDSPNCRIFDHVPRGRGKGCGIFSSSSRNPPQSKHKVAKDLYQLMSFVEKNDQTNPYQLVLIYASSGCPFQELAKDIEKLLNPEMTTLILGDFNFDRNEKNALTRLLSKKNFIQIVNFPMHKGGRTLDHCYISKNSMIKVSRHLPYYSDHSALCIEFQ